MRDMGCSLAWRWARNKSGTIAVQFGLIATVLFGFAGGAVDYLRWQNAAKVTREALDAAVLAGARAMQLDPGNQTIAVDTATAYFNAAVAGKVPYAVNTIGFTKVDNDTALTATGEAKINTMLLRVLGFTQLAIVNAAGANYPKASLVSGGPGGSNIEISLMLDVTGSMCDNGIGPCTSSTKLDGLKEAARRLVDTVIATNQSEYYSKMAIVPFSTRVRLAPDGQGGGIMKAVTDLDPVWTGWYTICTSSSGGGGSEDNGNWSCNQTEVQHMVGWKIMPCVTDRFYNSGWVYDYTDSRPGSNQWLNAHDGGRMTKSWDSTNATPTTQRGQTQHDPASHWNYNWNGSCADVSNSNVMMPLSSDKGALKARITGLEAYGATAGALGTAWSWYTLSPEWDHVFTGTSRPGDYSELTRIQANGRPALRKVAILMSDGVYNTFRGWKDQNQQEVSDYAKQLCTNMKAQGIEIFTVGLALDQLPAAERAIAIDTLQSCGTDLSHFYQTLNVQELQAAFQEIGFQLSSVRLTR